MLRCICPCQAEAERQRKEAGEQRNRMASIKRRRAQGLQDRYLYDYTFANNNGQNPLMKKACAYVEHWDEVYRENTGLLLFGNVGTGKAFFVGCIANALLDRDIPVLMTNFPVILNRLTGMFSEDGADSIASLGMYDLLIIDDLGVERNTEYAMEQIFTVIDCRYRSRKATTGREVVLISMRQFLTGYHLSKKCSSTSGIYRLCIWNFITAKVILSFMRPCGLMPPGRFSVLIVYPRANLARSVEKD